MSYRLGDRVRVTKGILKGQVGAVSVCKLKCIYFVQKNSDTDWFYAYEPFLGDELEPAYDN